MRKLRNSAQNDVVNGLIFGHFGCCFLKYQTETTKTPLGDVNTSTQKKIPIAVRRRKFCRNQCK